jgi:uncharacterized protein with HEPN domain
MRRDDPQRVEAILDDIGRFATSAARVVARGRERFFDPLDDDQRRIARSLLIDLSSAADRLPDDYRDAHPAINWRGIRGLRNVVAHDYQATDIEILWAALANRFPELVHELGIE